MERGEKKRVGEGGEGGELEKGRGGDGGEGDEEEGRGGEGKRKWKGVVEGPLYGSLIRPCMDPW